MLPVPSLALRRVRTPILAVAVVALAPNCSGPGPRGETVEGRCPESPLREAVRREGSLHLIVRLQLDTRPEAELTGEEALEQRRTIAELQDRLLADLAGTGVDVMRRYERLPLLAVHVHEPAVCLLLRSPLVRSMELDREDPYLRPT